MASPTDPRAGTSVLDDLEQRRGGVAGDGRRRAAAPSTAAPASSTPAPASTTCSTPGRSASSARSSAARRRRPTPIVMGSGRIDGRPVMVAAEDFTVKAGTISLGRQLEALPRRRARGRRPGAADHDARGRRLPGRRHAATRRTPDRPARPGPVLGPGAAGDRGARRVGRARRAGRADVGLHGDEPARVDLHGRPAGRARVARRDDHQGGPRRARRRRWRAA